MHGNLLEKTNGTKEPVQKVSSRCLDSYAFFENAYFFDCPMAVFFSRVVSFRKVYSRRDNHFLWERSLLGNCRIFYSRNSRHTYVRSVSVNWWHMDCSWVINFLWDNNRNYNDLFHATFTTPCQANCRNHRI